MTDVEQRVPLTLVAGFLGSGKTTLVNRILGQAHPSRVAVVVNEFGDVGIDGRLVVGAAERVVELTNGCICCAVRGDLQEALGDLLRRRGRRGLDFERVVVEGSGLASPGPVAQTLVVTPELDAELRLDGVVTLAHAALLPEQLQAHPEVAEQLGYADCVLLNHADRCSPEQLARARSAALEVNPHPKLLVSTRASVPLMELLDLRSGDSSSWELPDRPLAPADHAHDHGVGALTLCCDEELDLHRLKMWLRLLSTDRLSPCLRLKGVLRCREHAPPVVVQAIHQWLELGPGTGAAPARSVLVVIGKGLDAERLRRGFEACRAQA